MSGRGTVLSVQGLVKSYAGSESGALAVAGVSFEIAEGEFYTLLGPSGCGKTTTLRCVAGLEKTSAGRITLDGTVVSDHSPNVFVRTEHRDIGMVFQSYAIWPHMSVFDNVAFPLRAARRSRGRVPRGQVRSRVMDVLGRVRLEQLAGRMATKLSGGQQQRLALARALALEPKLLLLDEPLSNLDAGLREMMRTELRRLQRQLGVTTLYVTHDQAEALSMSNRVAVMDQGRIVQEARPREIYRRPLTEFVASFVGRTNLVAAKVAGRGAEGTLRLETSAGAVDAICPSGAQEHDDVLLSIRPEDLRLHAVRPDAGTGNVLPGRVLFALFLGECVEYHLQVGAEEYVSRQHPDVRFRREDQIFVELPVQRCVVVTDKYGTTDHANTADPDEDDPGPPDPDTLAVTASAGDQPGHA
jgi:iron(III) transport system ATP-binding protein